MKIFLTGYMGSGKSVIGKKLAESLKYSYVDLDDQIELIEGTRINDIFNEKGELYFRKLENKILMDILEETADLVVSLGGGTPCYGDNFDEIRNAGKTIYLKASVQELTERLFPEKLYRPVISHLDTRDKLEEFVRKHLFERAFYYNQSDMIIEVDEKKPAEIVKEILKKLQ